jgi:hypothetical protein
MYNTDKWQSSHFDRRGKNCLFGYMNRHLSWTVPEMPAPSSRVYWIFDKFSFRFVLSVWRIRSSRGGNLGLPLVAIGKKLLLVVQQLFSGLGGVLCVGSCAQSGQLYTTIDTEIKKQHTFNNSINRATLLAIATVDTLGHVDIVSGRSAASILTFFGFNGDGLGRADGFAKLASDAPLLTSRITAQSVFATETGRDGPFFEGVEDGVSGSRIVSAQTVHQPENKTLKARRPEYGKDRFLHGPLRSTSTGTEGQIGLTVVGSIAPAPRTCLGTAPP